LELLKNEDISVEKWNALLSISPYSTPFQSPLYYELFNSIPEFSSEVFAVEEDAALKALCVVTLQKESGFKGYFSRRAIIYGGPIINSNDNNILEYLLVSIKKAFERKAIYIEIRNLNNYKTFTDLYIRNKWQYLPYQNFIVDCSNKEILLSKFGNNRKRQIKKAISSDIKIKEAENINEVLVFFSILQNLYYNKIKKPLFPKEFFINFFERNAGKYLLVTYKENIIGGIICPIFNNKCAYELYVCGLDEQYKDQHPSVVATWAAMQYANEHDIPLFDFMGAGLKNQDYGVRKFKSRFGGELVEYGRYIFLCNKLLYTLGKISLTILRILRKR
jgi:serine/alanine adding enzyme